MPDFSAQRKLLPRHVDHAQKQEDHEEVNGVVLAPLKGANTWDTFNKRRVNSCVNCHRNELTEQGTPDRETPLGKWSPKSGVMGVRAKASYASRDDVLADLTKRREKLKPDEQKALDANVAALKRDKDKPSAAEYKDARAVKKPGQATKIKVMDMMDAARNSAIRWKSPRQPAQ